MIKKFAKLQVTDDGKIKCSKCGKVLTKSSPDYFCKNGDANNAWLTRLADNHFKRQICPAVMADAKAKLDIVQGHSPDVTIDDMYWLLI